MESKNKKTCYYCKYRGEVPGSCHTRCELDWGKATHEQPEGNEYGKKMGWFMWPWNYDPVWMIGQCKEFIQKPK